MKSKKRVYEYLELMNKIFDMTLTEEEIFFDEDFPSTNMPIEKFYNKEFNYNDIPKIFDEWELSEKTSKYTFFENKRNEKYKNIKIRFYYPSGGYMILIDGFTGYDFFKPKNINQFISNMQDINIELYWNQNMLNNEIIE